MRNIINHLLKHVRSMLWLMSSMKNNKMLNSISGRLIVKNTFRVQKNISLRFLQVLSVYPHISHSRVQNTPITLQQQKRTSVSHSVEPRPLFLQHQEHAVFNLNQNQMKPSTTAGYSDAENSPKQM